MTNKGSERRACARFAVPGATVYYKEVGFFFSREYSDDYYPLFDISLGGCNFLSQTPLKPERKVSLKIVIPGEEDAAIVLTGRVIWTSPHSGMSYNYQNGIQFNPYGTGRGDNAPECLERLKALEQKLKLSAAKVDS